MRPVKIGYILTPVEFGGAVKVSLTFLRHADRKTFDIHPIVLIRPWEKDTIFVQELKKNNYAYTAIPIAARPRSEGRDYFRIIRCYRILHSFLRKNSFDIVHTHGYFADILGIPAAWLSRTPHMATCHGFISIDRKLKFYNWLDCTALRFSNKIIAVSDDIRNHLVKKGIRGRRIITIPNAVGENCDVAFRTENRRRKRAELNIKEDELVIGYVGRLSEEKGVKYLVQAAAGMADRGVKVLVIGEGPQRGELEKIAATAGLEGKIIFAGFQRHIESWLPSFDIFVLPSLTEGTPVALLEAMACGIPVIASAVGGVPDVIIPEKNGILVSPGNVDEISTAMQRLHEHPRFRTSLAQAARKTIESKYHVRDWTKKIENEYLTVMHSR